MRAILLFTIMILISTVIFSQDTFIKEYSGNYVNSGVSIDNTSDGGYIISGNCNARYIYDSNGGKYLGDIWLLKFNQYGDTLWSKKIGINGYTKEKSYCVKEFEAGGYIISGYRSGNDDKSLNGPLLIKTDSNGNIEYSKMERLYNNYRLIVDGENFLVSGYSIMDTSMYTTARVLAKYDSQCNLIWIKNYDETVYPAPQNDLRKSFDKGYVIVGHLNGMGILTLKTDSLGNFEWQKVYFDGISETYGYSIEANDNETYTLTGIVREVENYSLLNRTLILGIDKNGDSLWSHRIRDYYDCFTSNSVKTNDQAVVLAGQAVTYEESSNHQILLIKVSDEGNIIWKKTFGYEEGFDIGASGITTDNSGNLILTGYKRKENSTTSSLIIAKLTSGGELTSIEEIDNKNIPANYSLSQNYPNPFNQETTIEYHLSEGSEVDLKIFNIQGEVVKTLVNGFKSAGKYKITFNAENISSDVYIYRLKLEDYIESKKMLLLK